MKNIPIADKIPELDVALESVIKAGNAILDIQIMNGQKFPLPKFQIYQNAEL